MTRDRRHPPSIGQTIRQTVGRTIGKAALGALLMALLAGASAPFHGAVAQTLEEALVIAYRSNPALQAERARIRAVDEEVPEALAGWRPTVEIAGDVGTSYNKTDGEGFYGGSDTVLPYGYGLSVVAPLYQGGRVPAQIESAENRVDAGRAQLRETEQTIMLDTVTAYMDVLRYRAEIELSRSSERVVRRQLQAAKDRLEVGEVTRTDVAQAEARLAQARAERVAAEGGLMSARAYYQQVTGEAAGTLSWPELPMALPETEEDALAAADTANPLIGAASFIAQAAQADIEIAAAALRPQISIRGNVGQRFDTREQIDETTDASLKATVRVPLYQGGATNARIRQAKQQAVQRRLEARSDPPRRAGAGGPCLAGPDGDAGADRRVRVASGGGGGRAGRRRAGDEGRPAHHARRAGRRTGALQGADQPGPGAAGGDRRGLSVEIGGRRAHRARPGPAGRTVRPRGALSERARKPGRMAVVGGVTAAVAEE